MQPAVLEEEFDNAPAIVRADPRWQAAMRRRGFALGASGMAMEVVGRMESVILGNMLRGWLPDKRLK